MTWRKSEDFAKETGELKRLVRGMLRRMAITLTSGTKWQVLGQRGGGGGDEVESFEAFTGIGFYARPPSSGNPEVVTGAIGGSGTTVAIATRDEATRQLAAGDLADGETCVYNDKAKIVVKADGTVEIRLLGGVAVALALKSDVEAVDTKYATHIHNDSTSAATKGPVQAGSILPSGGSPPFADGLALADADIVGTTVLKGQ